VCITNILQNQTYCSDAELRPFRCKNYGKYLLMVSLVVKTFECAHLFCAKPTRMNYANGIMDKSERWRNLHRRRFCEELSSPVRLPYGFTLGARTGNNAKPVLAIILIFIISKVDFKFAQRIISGLQIECPNCSKSLMAINNSFQNTIITEHARVLCFFMVANQLFASLN
jgi:hypothetical protein